MLFSLGEKPTKLTNFPPFKSWLMKGVLSVDFDMIRRKERAGFIQIYSRLGVIAQCFSQREAVEFPTCVRSAPFP